MKFLRKLRSLFRKKNLEAEMAEEMRFHLEQRAADHAADGLTSDEAHYAAQRQFGNVASLQEQAREERGWLWLEDFLKDLRHGARLLRKNPGFTATSVLVLGLGIGANTAVFNLVHSLLFAPPTYAHPAEIMRVSLQDKLDRTKTRDFSYPAYQEIGKANTVFTDVLASSLLVVGLGEPGDTRRASAAVVSANYFSVLGVAPAQGRAFLPDEATPGRAAPVVIVSHVFWKKHRMDPRLLGSTLTINGRPFTVIGIMPEGFTGTTALFFTELWMPLGVYGQLTNTVAQDGPGSLSDPRSTALTVIGRLKSGWQQGPAESALAPLAADLANYLPAENPDQILTLAPPSRFASSGNDTAVAWVGVLLLAMAAIVLLVACLNLTNMLLARGTARRKEIALRLALGSTRNRIIRQLLAEGLLLALLGAGAGLMLALWSSDLLVASLGRMIPLDLVWSAELKPELLAATIGFGVLGTLAFALGPALKLSRSDVITHLKEHAGEDVIRRRWKFLPRNPLVSAQLALSLVLLVLAALFTRSAIKAGAADTGLQADGVFLIELDASLGGYNQRQALDLYRRLDERLAALPGVVSASVATDVPLSGLDFERTVHRADAASHGQADTSAKWAGVGSDYFKTAGLPLLRGRSFTVAEATQGGPPVIINEELARRLWPDGDALGQRLQFRADGVAVSTANNDSPAAPGSEHKPDETFEIVGIVPSTRHTLFESQPDPGCYLPFAQESPTHVFLHVKIAAPSRDSESTINDLLRRTVREADSVLPILSVKSYRQHLEGNIQIWIVRTGATLFAMFGGLALCLAIVGTYGVIAYSVARRTREIGIRIALGARPGSVQRMIFGESAVMVVGGLASGLLLAVGLGKVVSSLLYQVGALDPVAFLFCPALLLGASFLACYIPARRATKVDPMVALRTE